MLLVTGETVGRVERAIEVARSLDLDSSVEEMWVWLSRVHSGDWNSAIQGP